MRRAPDDRATDAIGSECFEVIGRGTPVLTTSRSHSGAGWRKANIMGYGIGGILILILVILAIIYFAKRV